MTNQPINNTQVTRAQNYEVNDNQLLIIFRYDSKFGSTWSKSYDANDKSTY